MSEHRHAATARRYWEAAEARDWEGFGATVADDVRYDCPQTREGVTGREPYVRFNADYPGDWHLTVERLHADDAGAVAWTHFEVGGEVMTGQHWFTFAPDGRIATIVDFWPEPYEPPAGRAHLVDEG